MSTKRLRLAVLVSGGGTNLQALLDRSADGTLNADIVVAASDRADAYGLVRAQKSNVPTHVVDYKAHLQAESLPDAPMDLAEIDRIQRILRNPDPQKRLDRLKRLVLAEHEMLTILDRYEPDYICLAGFMRLVSPYFIRHYNQGGARRVLNIHPALLPACPGQHGYEDTFSYGCKWGGVTVHFVDEGEDTGPIIAQAVYPIWPGDTLDGVKKRGLGLEYEIYAQCVNWLAAGQVDLRRSGEGKEYTAITDPAYPQILQGWTQQAFG
ncbi:MAG: phosphoribosylglycinamide formyltransferase [Acidobacteriota bacterium]